MLRRADVEAALDLATCVDACEEAFAAYSTGRAELPSVISLAVPESDGVVHVKAGHIRGAARYAVKVASGFYANGTAVDGLVLVFDAVDGAPVAILLDGGHLTDLRTGAAGGVAAKHLAPIDARVAAIIGTGAQARHQTAALALARPTLDTVRVWGRDAAKADQCAAEIAAALDGAIDVAATPTVATAVAGADVVVTCTASREPLVRLDMLAPGAHVTAVGSDDVGKQELDPAILRQAELLVVDSTPQCARLGELQHALDQRERVVELGTICAGDHPGRGQRRGLTVCDLTGVGVQDVAAANAVMAAAGDRGERLPL